MHKLVKGVTSATVALGLATGGSAQTAPVPQVVQASPTVFYRNVSVDGVSFTVAVPLGWRTHHMVRDRRAE
jgi:hypothetical protein